MSYNPPGVEITQVQDSQSPVLLTPDLEAIVIGQSYWWQEMTTASEKYSSTVPSAVSLSGINSDHMDVTGEESLVLVDIQSGGARIPLTYNEDFTLNTVDGETTVTLVSGLQIENANVVNADIKIAYRTANADGEGFKVFDSPDVITSTFASEAKGKKSWNVLAYGLQMASDRAAGAVNGYGMSASSAVAVSSALDALETKEVYAMGFLTQKEMSTTIGNVDTHVVSMSTAINKKERIGFVDRDITFSGTNYAEDSSDKTLTAAAIKASNLALGEKRVFSIHPEVAYVQETRHISTLNPTWIAASFSDSTDVALGTAPLLAILPKDIPLTTKTLYKGSYITAAVYADLVAEYAGEDLELAVFAPVPGYYYTSAVAGQTVGKTPEAPLTNAAIPGFWSVLGSNDYFSEANLNTIAEGGTYIIKENAPGTLVCRHQLSTNMTSVALRELSVTTTIDFTAKFIRKALAPYIGRQTISPAFISLVNTVLVGVGFYLKRLGYINDLIVDSVTQDPINPDTLLIDVSILPKYPVNYMKIRLIF